jgi:hypothetical protein
VVEHEDGWRAEFAQPLDVVRLTRAARDLHAVLV